MVRLNFGLSAASCAALLSVAPVLAQNIDEYSAAATQYAQNELQSWITDPFVLYAIEEQNELFASMTAAQVAHLDEVWIGEEGAGNMTFDVLGRQGSIVLRERRTHSKGIITEIILMDLRGLNVAISDATSDYYQGDEAKFQETVPNGIGAIHVSDVELDESTGKYQTQVSMTIAQPESGVVIGAVTFGIDLDMLSQLTGS